MPKSQQEARTAWQEAWRRMPDAERGSARQVFAFISEYHRNLPTEWEDQASDPWTTIHSWLREADEADGIEWKSP